MLRKIALAFAMSSILFVSPLSFTYDMPVVEAEQQLSPEFRNEKIKPLLNSSLALYRNFKSFKQDTVGRSFDNMFRELSSLKEKNQALQQRAAEMNPTTSIEKELAIEMDAMLDSYDSCISHMIRVFEQQQISQRYEGNDNAKFQEAINNRDAQLKKSRAEEVAYMHHKDRVVELGEFKPRNAKE